MGGFKKWFDPSNGRDDFEMRGRADTSLRTMVLFGNYIILFISAPSIKILGVVGSHY